MHITSSEQKLFGYGPFKAYPMIATDQRRSINARLVVFGFIIATCSVVTFLLGVNVVIRYRTINTFDRVGTIRKILSIVCSVAAIYVLVRVVAWFFEIWTLDRSRPGYDSLFNADYGDDTPIEMSSFEVGPSSI
ncbi:uncharacterized protein KNAG_0G01090 [Huiozyma naganishii CBS 8797]|uniref:Uncharacterized protein n=1 Tax=Huiozyma naganishii (strain ATCC MYA-139 / BCRC 22969 / CBS 8797 / KCTC 17520 / NBRC 10181 / NCYC 3082 / Yp74L-3) TaxID=1071383 RepID=J7S0U6_HUIN7|nr:hypothetical protein KNAG_0G01090 [Kazachstania naganishii CBS 8797]CCK71167.1 hypothetical protein KNAG_0G01090 [Kazachstania naganishii CBS 8797]